MKKILLLLFFFISTLSYSQKDSSKIGYVAISIGYASGTNTQLMGYNNNYQNFSTPVRGSFGKGTKATLQLGYCWRSLLHFELAMSYKTGISYEANSVGGHGGGSSPSVTGHSNMVWTSSPQFQLLPSAKLNLGHTNNPYFKLGGVINLKNKLTKDSLNGYSSAFYTSSGMQLYNNSITVHQITEYTKPVSLGFMVAAGLEHYNETRNFAFFFEVSYIYMKWKADKVEVTYFQQDATGTYTANYSPVYENNQRSSCSIDIAIGVRYAF